jgi:VanZ family protein
MFGRFLGLAAWVLLALITYATISPIQERPSLLASSSLEHLVAFLTLGTLFCLAYPRRPALVCLIVLGSAILLEILQLLTPDRHARLPDAIEKIAGGGFGILAGKVMLYFEKVERLLTGDSKHLASKQTDDSSKSSCLASTKSLSSERRKP